MPDRLPVDELSRNRPAAMEPIAADFENVRAAWQHALDSNRFALIEPTLHGLYAYCNRSSRYQDAERLFDRAVEMTGRQTGAVDAATISRLRECRGRMRGLLGEFEGAIADLSWTREEARRQGNHAWERAVLIGLGQLFRKTSRGEEAVLHLSHALDGARASGDARGVADTLYHLGTLSWDEGDNTQSMAYHREAVEISRRLGLRDLVAAQAVHGLGPASFMAGQAQFAASTGIACAHWRRLN